MNKSEKVCRVQRRDSYGTVRIYPVGLVAQTFAALCGRKTLSPEELGLIECLGFEIEWLPAAGGRRYGADSGGET